MRADTVSAPLLSSDSHLRGARTVRVASALFPARASPGRGCAHDPTRRPACPTPTPHLSHATLRTPPRMRDDVRVARERWGVGVGHAERTRGRAHTQCGARPASLQRPPGWDAFGFCAAPLHVHGAERKGGGAFPHARTQMEGGGACRAGCVPPPILAVPPTRGPCPNGGATLHSVRAGRE